MIGLLDSLKIGLGAVVGAALCAPVAYTTGKHAGSSEAATAALEKTVELIHARDKINAQISAADAAALCGYFGLSDGDTEQCMRRVGEAAAKP